MITPISRIDGHTLVFGGSVKVNLKFEMSRCGLIVRASGSLHQHLRGNARRPSCPSAHLMQSALGPHAVQDMVTLRQKIETIKPSSSTVRQPPSALARLHGARHTSLPHAINFRALCGTKYGHVTFGTPATVTALGTPAPRDRFGPAHQRGSGDQ